MDGDGDILGMRRRPEVVQPAVPTATSAGGGSAPETAAAAATAAAASARHAIGASPLKRQRSVGGGPLARAESEDVEGPAGDIPVNQLNPEQLRRYKAWKRSRLERGPIRELILNRAAPTLVRSLESGQSRGMLQETSTIAVASMAKQFVGDLVEEAKRSQLERGASGPLQPSDLLEARETLARERRGPPLRSPTPRERGLVGGGTGIRGGGSLLGGGGVLTKGNPI